MKFKNRFNIGDQVSVVNDTMTGNIVSMDRDTIEVECTDGFLYTFNAAELILRKEWVPIIKHDMKDEVRESKSSRKKSFRSRKGTVVKEVDLHIHELVDSEKGMSNYDKLSLQLRTAQDELERAISKKHQKIIFIHGRGEGILKTELRGLLTKYPVTFHDASYTEYGQGATEVLIFQNKK